MGIRDIAKKVASSKGTIGGNYLHGGRGRAVIKNCSYSGGYKGDKFVAEMTVISSEENGVGKADPAGYSFSFLQMYTGNQEKVDTALNNTKSYLVAANGDSLEDFNAQADAEEQMASLMEAACSKDQPLRGVLVDFESRSVKTKAGKDIIVQNWRAVKNQTPEQIEAARKQLDA